MTQLRSISRLDLARFQSPSIPGDRSTPVKVLWYMANLVFLQSPLALWPSRWKVWVLRLFGARIGRGVVIKPRVTIKSPWFLEIGDHVWLGECAWIDNHTTVNIGANSCISQGAYLCTGNHDWKDPAFSFFCGPIFIGEGVWITAFQRIRPGSVIPPSVAVVDGRVEAGR